MRSSKEINSYIQSQQQQQRVKPSSSLLNTLNPHQVPASSSDQPFPQQQAILKEKDDSSRDNIAPIIEIIHTPHNDGSISQFLPQNEKDTLEPEPAPKKVFLTVPHNDPHKALNTSAIATGSHLLRQHQLAMLNSWTSMRGLADGTKGLIGAGAALTINLDTPHQNTTTEDYQNEPQQPRDQGMTDGSVVGGAINQFSRGDKFAADGSETNTYMMTAQQFTHNSEKLHENAKLFAIRFFNIPPSTRDALAESFRVQSLLDNLSFNACLGTIYPFLVAYQFIMTTMAPAERKNMTVRLIAAFGIPKEHTFENLAVRCAIIFISSLPKQEKEKFSKITYSKPGNKNVNRFY
eukprot:GDKK01009482.1.p1 GENE.GDKK01009482.1~~GDKK01009482.1.p1  ORF type:complete len:349 (+),score=21.18 GDKK01009482.1:418-1464(+)